jgi:hypothetical protein
VPSDSPVVEQDFYLFLAVFVSTGVCLIMSESSGDTAAKGGPNSNGSYDYGLFQVSVPHMSLRAVAVQYGLGPFEHTSRGFESSSEHGLMRPSVLPCVEALLGTKGAINTAYTQQPPNISTH